LQERLLQRPNIRIVWDHVVEEIVGTPAKPPMAANVTGARLRHVQTGTISQVDVDGVFIAIGHAPATSLFEGQLRLKSGNYIWTVPDSTATSVPGVFAAGDVADDAFRQAVTAAGRGCMAALETERYLAQGSLEQQAAE